MKLKGGCSCAAVRYQLTSPPLIVHACHCRDCQRISGSAFVINLWIERRFVKADTSAVKSFTLKGGTGKRHDVFFCGICGTYLWSRYHLVRGECLFVRGGTLDTPDAIKPDVHIFTRTKVPWLKLPDDARAFKTGYSLDKVWSPKSLARLAQNASLHVE
ncbi:MAG: GFA family protein [Candidatus Binataceae bacterium]|nr:GFA family protein [Candidatus Binataceae bacterium]